MCTPNTHVHMHITEINFPWNCLPFLPLAEMCSDVFSVSHPMKLILWHTIWGSSGEHCSFLVGGEKRETAYAIHGFSPRCHSPSPFTELLLKHSLEQSRIVIKVHTGRRVFRWSFFARLDLFCQSLAFWRTVPLPVTLMERGLFLSAVAELAVTSGGGDRGCSFGSGLMFSRWVVSMVVPSSLGLSLAFSWLSLTSMIA